MRVVLIVLLIVCMSPADLFGQEGAVVESAQNTILVVELKGPITPAVEDLVDSVIDASNDEQIKAVLLALDTPGGLVESMRRIIQSIHGSPKPFLVWVGPSGARAASAGVFLVAASHGAAMSPQSTIGAASPVGMGGGDLDSTMKSKIENDLKSLARSLAVNSGRNSSWYETAVSEADSITAQEAVINHVVEFIAEDPDDFIEQLLSRGHLANGRPFQIESHDFVVRTYEPSLRYTFLSWLLNPQIAYLLMLGAMAGLFFELTTPGAVFPGVFGGLCLLLALYALSILPTNIAGVLLVLFAGVLLILEIYITSFGLLGVTALISLFVGSIILIRPTPGIEGISLAMSLSTVLTVGIILLAGLIVIAKSQRQGPVQGPEALIGLEGKVLAWNQDSGRIMLRGEMWKAKSTNPLDMTHGAKVIVTAVDGLTVQVHESLSEDDGDEV